MLCLPCDGYKSVKSDVVRVLEETAVFQVVFDDDVGNGVEHKLDVVGICGTGEVRVDLLRLLALVEVFKLHLDVGSGLLIGVLACVVWEADRKGRFGDLLLEEILFVEEQDDRCVREPLVVTYRVEQLHGLVHSVHFFVFGEHQVIRG